MALSDACQMPEIFQSDLIECQLTPTGEGIVTGAVARHVAQTIFSILKPKERKLRMQLNYKENLVDALGLEPRTR